MAETTSSSSDKNILLWVLGGVSVALLAAIVWTYLKTKAAATGITGGTVKKLNTGTKPPNYGNPNKPTPTNPYKPTTGGQGGNNVNTQLINAAIGLGGSAITRAVNGHAPNAAANPSKNPKNTKNTTTPTTPVDKITDSDPSTGAYQENGRDWYLADGTPLYYYDRRGAYQEEDGRWYLFDGTDLLDYDLDSGSYQEMDGLWYDVDGNPIASASWPQYGVYQEADGTYYNEDGIELSEFDPNTGNYKEKGDDTLYDYKGNVISEGGGGNTTGDSGGGCDPEAVSNSYNIDTYDPMSPCYNENLDPSVEID